MPFVVWNRLLQQVAGRMPTYRSLNRWLLVVTTVLAAGCERSAQVVSKDQVIVYCSVDESFARSILSLYEQRSGVTVSAVFDSEAGKTTGLVNKIRVEVDTGRTRSDVFWSSEPFNTILLARDGYLVPYVPKTAGDIPARYVDPKARWTGVAVRARVLAFDPKRNSAESLPDTWEELATPPFAGRLAFANPLFGTTRGHIAAMFAVWGPQRATKFLEGLRDNGAQMVDGNSAAVRAVISGRVDWAATDTDDVWLAKRGGHSIDLKYLDMGGGGTLLVPCSVAIVRGAQNHESARRLVDFLVSDEVERLLAQSDSRNIPVRGRLRKELGLTMPIACEIDFSAVADAMDVASAATMDILIR